MIQDIRPKQTATAVLLVSADSDWTPASGFMLPHSQSRIQWATFDWEQLGLVSYSLNHHHFFRSFKFLLNSCSVTFLSAHYWNPSPTVPSTFMVFRALLPSECLLTGSHSLGWALQGGGQTALAFVWSSSFHVESVYTLGRVVKPVRVASCMSSWNVLLVRFPEIKQTWGVNWLLSWKCHHLATSSLKPLWFTSKYWHFRVVKSLNGMRGREVTGLFVSASWNHCCLRENWCTEDWPHLQFGCCMFLI